eukprot:CAMPEP_0115513812 /NCGR_PEP_ID=MMETSP0271-20121206/75290_1 /TAXON_ID=71861 /ORGANISM="Scrippsiella trochoidea, Strain CCMP3099" /LENGTH=52 /DNA_ID=CAMNT_0002944157 /DNA_START=271 /DNA_END=429 /DNA_ORIENTATION=-
MLSDGRPEASSTAAHMPTITLTRSTVDFGQTSPAQPSGKAMNKAERPRADSE